jgi:hypothetical protein
MDGIAKVIPLAVANKDRITAMMKSLGCAPLCREVLLLQPAGKEWW